MSLILKNVCAKYNQNNINTLNNINLSIDKGKLLCVCGKNGCGKSTLFTVASNIKSNEIISYSLINNNLVNPRIYIDNKSIYSFTRKQLSSKIAYLIQNEERVWNYKVKDVVVMGRYCHTNFAGTYSKEDWEIVDYVLQSLNILNYKERNIFELSGGEWQKVRIARCLAQQSDFILLDEPVANLDFEYQAELLSFIKNYAHQKNIGVVVSIHDVNTASRFADEILLISKNTKENENNFFIKGEPSKILTPQNLRKIYNAEFGTFIHPEYKCIQIYQKNNLTK